MSRAPEVGQGNAGGVAGAKRDSAPRIADHETHRPGAQERRDAYLGGSTMNDALYRLVNEGS